MSRVTHFIQETWPPPPPREEHLAPPEVQTLGLDRCSTNRGWVEPGTGGRLGDTSTSWAKPTTNHQVTTRSYCSWKKKHVSGNWLVWGSHYCILKKLSAGKLKGCSVWRCMGINLQVTYSIRRNLCRRWKQGNGWLKGETLCGITCVSR